MELSEIAAKLAVDDIVVFGRRDDELLLCGGIGRGAGWAGVVQTTLSAEPLVARAIDEGITVRRAESRPQRVVGPYWASAFALVPVGGDHVVVFGGERPIAALLPDAEPSSVPAVIERIRAACAEWSGEHPERELRVSVGWGAPGADGDLRSALRVADERLYAAKRAVRRSA